MIWYYDSLWISKKWNVIQKNMGMRANCGSSMITGNWLFNQPVLCPNQTWRWGQFRAIPSKFPGRDKWTQSNWFSSSPQLVTGSFGEVLVFPISMANLRCQQHRFHEYIFLDMVPIVEATTSLRTSSTQGFPSWKIVVSPVTRLERLVQYLASSSSGVQEVQLLGGTSSWFFRTLNRHKSSISIRAMFHFSLC